MIPAAEALERLRTGNRAFVDGQPEPIPAPRPSADPQRPFAIVLSCADSRAPVEAIFSQGLGDLFVVRVAGNIVTPPQLGSIEFAAAEFGSRLIVVMGHSGCGAVAATVEAVRANADAPSDGLKSIVASIRPSVERMLEEGDDDVVARSVRANVMASVEQLRHGSPILDPLIRDDGLTIVGAEYDLGTGAVTFIDG